MSEEREGGAKEVSGMDRRSALKVIAAAAAAPGLLVACDSSEGPDPAMVVAPPSNPLAAGTKWDPDLIDPVVPWERTLGDHELDTLAALCDMILPADERSPAASELGAHEFVDEWVSAPYEAMQQDKVLVRGGITWLDAESKRRFAGRFVDLTSARRAEICDDICGAEEVPAELQFAARFFDKVRDLTTTAYYTTREGMEDVGYVGNTPLASWGPPPPEVLRKVGLDPDEVSA